MLATPLLNDRAQNIGIQSVQRATHSDHSVVTRICHWPLLMNRSKLGFFQDLGTRACVMSMLKRAAMCGAITLTFSCPLPLCLGTRFVAHLIKVGVIVLKTDEKAGFLFWRCGLRPGRAAHCHQACEKAEDYLAVHWLYLYTTASLNDVRPLTLQLYSMKACAFQGFTDKAISQNVRLLGCVCKMCDNCDICCHSTRLVAPT